MRNRRGQGGDTSLGTLITIIVLVVLLVLIIIGVTGGFANFFSKINPFGGSSNVQAIIQACELACSQPQDYDYCTLNREVKYPKDIAVTADPVTGKKVYTKTLTCDKLKDETGAYKVEMASCSKTCTLSSPPTP